MANIEDVAHYCARPVRGCSTGEQYTEVVERIEQALAEFVNNECERCAKIAEALSDEIGSEIAAKIRENK